MVWEIKNSGKTTNGQHIPWKTPIPSWREVRWIRSSPFLVWWNVATAMSIQGCNQIQKIMTRENQLPGKKKHSSWWKVTRSIRRNSVSIIATSTVEYISFQRQPYHTKELEISIFSTNLMMIFCSHNRDSFKLKYKGVQYAKHFLRMITK